MNKEFMLTITKARKYLVASERVGDIFATDSRHNIITAIDRKYGECKSYFRCWSRDNKTFEQGGVVDGVTMYTFPDGSCLSYRMILESLHSSFKYFDPVDM